MKPSKDVNAAQDFIQIVTLGHVVAATMSYFEMTEETDEPKDKYLQSITFTRSKKEKEAVLFHTAILNMLKHHVILTTLGSPDSPESSDKVNTYAKEMLSLGLLMSEFEDAIKEGDGLRVIRCWRFLLLIFKSAKRKNYAIEAFKLLMQYQVLLPPRCREQLLWSRFVNLKGKPGCNIPADLHNEHLNRVAKTALGGQSSNCTPKTIERTGKLLGTLVTICDKFDEDTKVHKCTSKHATSSFKKDLKMIVTQLFTKSKVFDSQPLRQHMSFPRLNSHIVAPLKSGKARTKFIT